MKIYNTPCVRFLHIGWAVAVVAITLGQACTANLGNFSVCTDNSPNCQPNSTCRIGGNPCAEGLVCIGAENAMPGATGRCQPECLIGSNESCPPDYLCVGAEPGAMGTCQRLPQCYVGDNSCGEGLACVGTGGNNPGAPGTCQRPPECRVGDDSCGEGFECVGTGDDNPGAPGVCQRMEVSPEPECYVGAPWTCPANNTCVGAPGAPLNAPGTCQHSPRPWDMNQLYIFFGHNSVGSYLVNDLRGANGPPAQPGLRVVSRASAQLQQFTNEGANSFGSPNRSPALLDMYYALHQNHEQAIQQIDYFVQHTRNIMNGHTHAGQHIPPQRLDVVLMKLCFVTFDNGRTTDAQVDTLFDYYAAQMDALQSEFPELIVAHFTQATRPCGANNQTDIHAGNRRRMRYRQRILERYRHTERVFDLTELEATDPQGNVRYCNYNDAGGNPVLGLLQEYTWPNLPNDGHIYPQDARDRVARAFAHFIRNIR